MYIKSIISRPANLWKSKTWFHLVSCQIRVATSRGFKAETTILALFDKYCQKRQFFSDELLNQQKWKLPFLTIFAVFGNKHRILMGYSIFKLYRGIDELFQGGPSLDFPRGFCSFFRFSKGVYKGFQGVLTSKTGINSCFPGPFSQNFTCQGCLLLISRG